jgi:hypothetical protein
MDQLEEFMCGCEPIEPVEPVYIGRNERYVLGRYQVDAENDLVTTARPLLSRGPDDHQTASDDFLGAR